MSGPPTYAASIIQCSRSSKDVALNLDVEAPIAAPMAQGARSFRSTGSILACNGGVALRTDITVHLPELEGVTI